MEARKVQETQDRNWRASMAEITMDASNVANAAYAASFGLSIFLLNIPSRFQSIRWLLVSWIRFAMKTYSVPSRTVDTSTKMTSRSNISNSFTCVYWQGDFLCKSIANGVGYKTNIISDSFDVTNCLWCDRTTC